MRIHYKKLHNYKYMITRATEVATGIEGCTAQVGTFIRLRPDGSLTIGENYAWDGPSGPTVDTKNFMRSSLVHDVFYQLMRENKVPRSKRKQADQLLRTMSIEDDMCRFRAWYVYWAVRVGGAITVRMKSKSSKEFSAP